MAFSPSLPLLAGAEYSLWLPTGNLEEGHMGMGLKRGSATENLPFTSLGLWGPVTMILCHGNSSGLNRGTEIELVTLVLGKEGPGCDAVFSSV